MTEQLPYTVDAFHDILTTLADRELIIARNRYQEVLTLDATDPRRAEAMREYHEAHARNGAYIKAAMCMCAGTPDL